MALPNVRPKQNKKKDGRRFDHLKLKGVPAGALNTLSANLMRHNSNATPAKLQAELLSLSTNWASFSESVRKES